MRGSGSDSYEHLAQISDEELVDRFNNGDNAACQVLFDRHGGTIYAVVNSAGGDPEWTEDMVMDVFCEVLESLHSFSGRSSFATWLRQVAQNIVYSELRKRAHRYEQVELAEDCAADALDVAEVVVQRDLAARALGHLSRLPEKPRIAIALRFLKYLTYREIAEVLGEAVGTVKWRVADGLRRLRSMLAKEQDSEDEE